MVRDGLKMKSEGGFDELEEVEEEMMDDEEKAGGGEMRKGKGVSMRKVWIEAFTLTFLAEWGDRFVFVFVFLFFAVLTILFSFPLSLSQTALSNPSLAFSSPLLFLFFLSNFPDPRWQQLRLLLCII